MRKPCVTIIIHTNELIKEGEPMKTRVGLFVAIFAFAAAQSAWADEIVDLGGESVSVDGSGFKSAYNGKTIQNGTVTVTGAGTQPAAVKEIYPVTAGVSTISTI